MWVSCAEQGPVWRTRYTILVSICGSCVMPSHVGKARDLHVLRRKNTLYSQASFYTPDAVFLTV
jgi:hypothetical protein